MGSSESSCYEFCKEEKIKSKTQKCNFDKQSTNCKIASTSVQSLPTSEITVNQVSNGGYNATQASFNNPVNDSSNDDVYTPIHQTVKAKIQSNASSVDPRSPTDGIFRTPLQLEKIVPCTKVLASLDHSQSSTKTNCILSLEDPPDKTSIDDSCTPIHQLRSKIECYSNLVDPRSPSDGINRTPLQLEKIVPCTKVLEFTDYLQSHSIKNNSAVSLENQSDNNYTNDSCTPIHRDTTKVKYNANPLDPRSPSEGINRTPLQFDKIVASSEVVASFDGLQSPSVGIYKTPILQQKSPSADNLCSPSILIHRTPLSNLNPSGNLRRAVLLSNISHFSPISDLHACTPDNSFQSEYDTAFETLPKANNTTCSSEQSFLANSDDNGSLTALLTKNPYEPNAEIHNVLTQVVDYVCSSETSSKQSLSIDNMHLLNSNVVALMQKKVESYDDSINEDVKLTASDQTCISVNSESNNATQSDFSDISSSIGSLNELKKSHCSFTKSYIPLNFKNADRKRRAKVDKSKLGTNRNENLSEFYGEKSGDNIKKLQLHTARSPLTVLSHRNSPEPKRLRSNINDKRETEPDTHTDKKTLIPGTSRLPRYKASSKSTSRS